MIVAIIQARMGSTRLPGKILINVAGRPILEHIIDRVKKSQFIDKIVVATTTQNKDKVITALARKCNIESFAGSEEDALDRYYQAAKAYEADIIVRITADDPFKDPEVIDKVVTCYLGYKSAIDYVSNTINPTYPLGLDVEVFSFDALERAWREAKEPSEREHVTQYIWEHPETFRLANVQNEEDLSHLRWTLDTEADLEFIQEVYAMLYREGEIFLMDDILDLLKKEPRLVRVNKK